jgi:hypothetical protein
MTLAFPTAVKLAIYVDLSNTVKSHFSQTIESVLQAPLSKKKMHRKGDQVTGKSG